MKKITFLSAFAFAMIIGVKAQTPAAKVVNPNQAEIQFEETLHDFGNIKEGTQATFEFKFKNIGKEPLIISDVQRGCGCTTPVWPKEPIAPGKTAVVTATFDSNGRPGVFNKIVTVTSNGKTSSVVLTLKGFVENTPKPQPPVIQPTPPKP
ncbi:MAG: DUF1573 domain-containing protein [Bacteroidota bacterium]|nr:DUF1573 domain-containing protein [Bacteroidota bacterium]